MDKRIVTLLGSLVVMVLALSLFNLYSGLSTAKQIGYVNLNRIYTSLNYTLEVKSTLQKMEMERRNSLDSLGRALMQMDSLAEEQSYQTLKWELETKTQKYQEELRQYANFYDEKIWTLINEQVKVYGEKNGYSILLGSKGDGNIMYADSALEETDRVIQFMNESAETNP